MQPGAPGFYPGASPTEFGTYGKQGKGSVVRVPPREHLSGLLSKTFLGVLFILKMIGLIDDRD